MRSVPGYFPGFFAGMCAALAASVGIAWAEPAIIYSTGGKFDSSFNESAWRGAERYKAETGNAYAEFEIQTLAQSEQAIRRFASEGHNPVVVIGFGHAAALEKAAPDFPGTQFAIVDMVVGADNVRSIVFRYHEAAYLAGLLAAEVSQSGTVGIVGGMDIPIIEQFRCGYAQGAAAGNENAKVLYAAAGDTMAAWADPGRGAEIAKGQIDQGADVIIQAAGGTGVGVLQAAADNGILGIGTDSNQNGLHPGKILTSVRKRLDVAVFDAFMAGDAGAPRGEVTVLGLKEGGLDWVIDDNNRALISAETESLLNETSAGISAGEIKVHDSLMEGPCPR